MGIGGEADAAVLLRDDHAEEALLLHVLPGFRRKVVVVVRGNPVVGEAAQFLGLVVEEGLLFRREPRLRIGEELFPVGAAAEQLALPPDAAGLERLLLRLRHLRQHPAIGGEERPRQQRAAQRPDGEERRQGRQRQCNE